MARFDGGLKKSFHWGIAVLIVLVSISFIDYVDRLVCPCKFSCLGCTSFAPWYCRIPLIPLGLVLVIIIAILLVLRLSERVGS